MSADCSKIYNVSQIIKSCKPYTKCRKIDIITWLEKEKLTGLKIKRWIASGGGCDFGIDCDLVEIRVLTLGPNCALPFRIMKWDIDPTSTLTNNTNNNNNRPRPAQSEGGGTVEFTPRY